MGQRSTTIASGTPGDLLRLIRSGEATTRAELALTTGLARSTIAQRIESLDASGWIKSSGEAPSTGGRPATVLGFNEDSGTVLVADLGATHSRVAMANLAGEILAETTADIEIASGPEHVPPGSRRCSNSCSTRLKHRSQPLLGLESGFPVLWSSRQAGLSVLRSCRAGTDTTYADTWPSASTYPCSSTMT